MSARGGIHRGTLPSDHFTIVENDHARDATLSYKARGILVVLLSHDPGWVVRLTDLVTDVDGLSSVRSGVRELENAGYLTRSRVRLGDGSYGPDRWDLGSPDHVRKSHEDAA